MIALHPALCAHVCVCVCPFKTSVLVCVYRALAQSQCLPGGPSGCWTQPEGAFLHLLSFHSSLITPVPVIHLYIDLTVINQSHCRGVCACVCFSHSTCWLRAQGRFHTHPNSFEMCLRAFLYLFAHCSLSYDTSPAVRPFLNIANTLHWNAAWAHLMPFAPLLFLSGPCLLQPCFSCTSCFPGSGCNVCSQCQRSCRTGVPVLARTGPSASLPLSPPLLIWHGERTVCSIVLCVNTVMLSCFVWLLQFCNIWNIFFQPDFHSWGYRAKPILFLPFVKG